MRIASLLNENLNNEERKRANKQKEMNEAYKKNASYTPIGKKPMFEAIENLLSSKEDKVESEKSEGNAQVLGLQADEEVSNDTSISSAAEYEQRKMPYFSQAFPFHQTIQNTENVLRDGEETGPIDQEPLDVFIPERFKKDFNRKSDEETLFGKNLERTLFERTFNKATKSYSFHMQMAQNGFAIQQSQYSLTA